ncbi:Dipeptide transport system permease protein DppC [Lachnospiraceae bacterium TWA4]|nr:Dipeptide transport system permease protein DppC [Lachnospiraceae bacterium TWA4]
MKKSYRLNLTIGMILLVILGLATIVSIFYMPYDPDKMSAGGKLLAPSFSHIFGTDNFGRDIYSRVVRGLGTTFYVGMITVGIGTVVGTILGAFTGYYGGVIDEVLMRFNDAVASFPSILVALVFISILGPGRENLILALGLIFIPSFARIVRAEVLKEKTMDYVKSAKLMGASSFRIIFVHILPNTFSVLLSSIAIGFNNAVLAEAGMSYLGIGVQPPNASLGSLLSDSQSYLFKAPWFSLFPGLVLICLILGFTLVSDALNQKNREAD